MTEDALSTLSLPPFPMTDITLTIGAMEAGMTVATFLTGALTVQTWNYFRDCEEDRPATKILVAGICVAEVVHTAFLMHGVYHYTVAFFGDRPALDYIVWSMQCSLAFVGPTTFAIRTWFCVVRVYRLTGRRLVALVCWLPSLAALVLATSTNVYVFLAATWKTAATPAFRGQITALFVTSAVADIAIASIICFRMEKLRSGLRASDKLVDRLVAYTIASGLLTSVGSCAEAITYLLMENFVFMAVCFVVAKLVSNSLLASLNGRNRRRQEDFHVTLNWAVAESSHGDGATLVLPGPQ